MMAIVALEIMMHRYRTLTSLETSYGGMFGWCSRQRLEVVEAARHGALKRRPAEVDGVRTCQSISITPNSESVQAEAPIL